VADYTEKICETHGLTLFIVDCHKQARCRKCKSQAEKKRLRRLKAKAVAYKGGKCIHCGYKKCQAALDFNHRDPSTKKFNIGDGAKDWDVLKKELDKTDLVCTNCHREIERNTKTERKRKCVDYKGGKCTKCNYEKCLTALEFHHRDRTTKKFNIARSLTTSWARVKKELDKCDLVCSNCHREIEFGEQV